jgi:phosphoglycolate phosphatase
LDFSAPPCPVILFDFDGTLADTFPRMERLLPRVARELRFRVPSPEEIRALREMRLPQILADLRIPWWKVPLVVWRARALLACGPVPVELFPGIAELLHDLDGAGVEWGIQTTNGLDLVRRTLRHNQAPEPGWIESGVSLSGKARRLRRFAQVRAIPPGDLLLVADETRDVQAALEAGVSVIAVGWGYNTPRALADAGASRIALEVAQLREMLVGKGGGSPENVPNPG